MLEEHAMISDHLLGHIGQYVLLKNRSGFLLMRKTHATNTWGLPGGRIEEGEHWEESLKREVKEESDLDISHPKPVAVHLTNEGSVMKYCVYFAANYRDDARIRFDKKTHLLQWIAYKEIGDLQFETSEIKEIALAFLREK